MDRLGIIDLGTNTFHLLILENGEAGMVEIYRKRTFVKLAEEGIDQIGEAAQQRAINTMISYRAALTDFEVVKTHAVGTAALRRASNAKQLIESIQSETGIQVEVIDGHREAKLIANGVQAAWNPATASNALIMDIGGGSVEFILASPQKIEWSLSLPIGVAVLHQKFHHSNPISPLETSLLHSFLEREMEELIDLLQSQKISLLIGASGTFDVVADLLGLDPDARYAKSTAKQVQTELKNIANSTIEARLNNPKIPASRVDMIVVASLLILKMLQLHAFKEIGISKYALKEGLAREIFSQV